MNKNNIYVLFGTEESISNYTNSIENLLNKISSVDYLVCCYEKLNREHTTAFTENLNRFQSFLFIPFDDYQIIYRKLCTDARTFMKKK